MYTHSHSHRDRLISARVEVRTMILFLHREFIVPLFSHVSLSPHFNCLHKCETVVMLTCRTGGA